MSNSLMRRNPGLYNPAASRERAVCQGLMEGMRPVEPFPAGDELGHAWHYRAESGEMEGQGLLARQPMLFGLIAMLMALMRA